MSRNRSGGPDEAPLVYSTDGGRRCRNCGQRIAQCRCRIQVREAPAAAGPSDGRVRVRRETKGRKGKTVTTISGLPGSPDDLRELAAELKRLCGCGGAIKEGVIEIQGDHADAIVAALEEQGLRVKRAGG